MTRVGIVAGRGVFPFILCEQLINKNYQVAIAGLQGQFSGKLPNGYLIKKCFPIGAIKNIADYFKEQGISEVYMAGGIMRQGLVKKLRPDLNAMKIIAKAILKGDDKILRLVAQEYEKLGVKIEDPAFALRQLMAPKGLIAGLEPGIDTKKEIIISCQAAIEHGKKDRGQAAIVYKKKIAALETIKGTDHLIANSPGPGAVLAKMVKPGQDKRFDLPAIGPSTALLAKAVGIKAIAVEAGGVLLLKKNRLIEICNEEKITLIGV